MSIYIVYATFWSAERLDVCMHFFRFVHVWHLSKTLIEIESFIISFRHLSNFVFLGDHLMASMIGLRFVLHRYYCIIFNLFNHHPTFFLLFLCFINVVFRTAYLMVSISIQVYLIVNFLVPSPYVFFSCFCAFLNYVSFAAHLMVSILV